MCCFRWFKNKYKKSVKHNTESGKGNVEKRTEAITRKRSIDGGQSEKENVTKNGVKHPSGQPQAATPPMKGKISGDSTTPMGVSVTPAPKGLIKVGVSGGTSRAPSAVTGGGRSKINAAGPSFTATSQRHQHHRPASAKSARAKTESARALDNTVPGAAQHKHFSNTARQMVGAGGVADDRVPSMMCGTQKTASQMPPKTARERHAPNNNDYTLDTSAQKMSSENTLKDVPKYMPELELHHRVVDVIDPVFTNEQLL